jgi:hypothetical protein
MLGGALFSESFFLPCPPLPPQLDLACPTKRDGPLCVNLSPRRSGRHPSGVPDRRSRCAGFFLKKFTCAVQVYFSFFFLLLLFTNYFTLRIPCQRRCVGRLVTPCAGHCGEAGGGSQGLAAQGRGSLDDRRNAGCGLRLCELFSKMIKRSFNKLC